MYLPLRGFKLCSQVSLGKFSRSLVELPNRCLEPVGFLCLTGGAALSPYFTVSGVALQDLGSQDTWTPTACS